MLDTPTPRKVWIVVLNWRNGPDTVDCLQSIVDCAEPEIRGVVVCDNDSRDQSVALIERWAERQGMPLAQFRFEGGDYVGLTAPAAHTASAAGRQFVLIHTGGNLGFAGGNNVGMAFVQRFREYDFLFLLNNDAILTPGTVPAMLARFGEGRIGMCGCTVVYHHSPSQVQALGGAHFVACLGRASHIGAGTPVSAPRDAARVERRLDYVLGAALMISRACFEAIGPMDERYFLYYEEVDWATRARRMGFGLGYAPTAVVFHKEGATIGSSAQTRGRSLLSEHYLVRSRLLYTRKFHLPYLPFVTAYTLAQVMRSFVRRDFRRFVVGLRALVGRPWQKEVR